MPGRRLLLLTLLLLCAGVGVLLLSLQVAPSLPPPSALLGRNSPDPARMCGPAYLALVVVHDADAHTRQLIRETWAHPFHSHPLGLSVAFSVSVDEPTEFENAVFGDILHIQADYDGPLDLLQAAREACRKPPFIAVVEKEVFVNVFALVDWLKELQKRPLLLQHRNAIWCHVSEEDNNASAATGQPRYCLPGAFITVPNAADTLLLTENSNNISQTIMSVTGVLAREAGVELVQMGERFDQDLSEKRALSGQTFFVKLYIGMMGKLWKKLVEGRKDSGL